MTSVHRSQAPRIRAGAAWARLPLRRKILTLILSSTLATLQLSALLILGHQWLSHRSDLEAELARLADLVGSTTAAAILLDSPWEAERTLASLRSDPRVVAAEIRTPAGERFAGYLRDRDPEKGSAPELETELEGSLQSIRGGRLRVLRPVLVDGRPAGSIALVAEVGGLYRQLARTALAIVASMTLCTLVAFFFSRRLVRLVARPILDLTSVAGEVARSQDYTRRAPERSGDELGQLAGSFNEILGEIERRDEELRRAHAELQDWIGEYKRTQERGRDLQERLARSEKMESLGALAGGVAHDLNNILGPMVGYPDLMLDRLGTDDPLRRDVEIIKESALRAAAIIQDLLTLARRGSYAIEPVRLEDVIRRSLDTPELLGSKSPHPAVVVELEAETPVDPVLGSAPHLSQVATNLILNACEAMPAGGVLAVRVYSRTFGKDFHGYERIPPGRYSVLAVSDTGNGIPDQEIGRVFEPFSSRRALGRSISGLGLAVVWGVVKDLGGYVDVSTRAAEGTTFTLYLPASSPEAEPDSKKRPGRGAERILVVDDEAVQRELAARVLESLGYSVSVCDTGRQALRYLGENHVDLVVLDMNMEDDFDGLATFRSIREKRPEQRCLIASGYSAADRVNEAIELGAGGYVPKPYTRESIGAAVRRALDRVPG